MKGEATNKSSMHTTGETHIFKAVTNIGTIELELTDKEAQVLMNIVNTDLSDPSKTLFLKVLMNGAKEAHIYSMKLVKKDEH